MINLHLRPFAMVIALVLALVPATAFAAEQLQGAHVVIGPNEVVNDDVNAVGGVVDVQGTVRGDVTAVGASVNVSGNVTGDVIAPGGAVSISGHVGGAVRALGISTTISGTVDGDTQVGGRTVVVAPTAHLGQNLLIIGSTATVDGNVGRDLRAYVDSLTLGGPVAGNVRVNVDTLKLTSSAAIKGDLVYTSENQATIAPGASVKGTTEHRSPRSPSSTPTSAFVAEQVALSWPGTQVGIYLLGLAFVLLFPDFARRTIGTVTRSPLASVALGFAVLVDVPILALILFVFGLAIGGWWLGLIVLALYGVAIPLASVIASLFVGYWIFAYSGRSGAHLAVALLLGLLLLTILGLVPVVGGIVTFVALLFGLGSLVLTLVRVYRVARWSRC